MAPNSKAGEKDVIIKVRGLVNGFGKKIVHDHIDLDVYRGEVLGVVGGSGAGTQIINGVPQQFSSAGVSTGDATMLFVDGAITGLSGPSQGQPAIQNGTALTVVASGNRTRPLS